MGILNQAFQIRLQIFKDNILNQFCSTVILGVEDMLNLNERYLHLYDIIHASDHLKNLELSAELIADFLNSF
jgi:hypothetical protein